MHGVSSSQDSNFLMTRSAFNNACAVSSTSVHAVKPHRHFPFVAVALTHMVADLWNLFIRFLQRNRLPGKYALYRQSAAQGWSSGDPCSTHFFPALTTTRRKMAWLPRLHDVVITSPNASGDVTQIGIGLQEVGKALPYAMKELTCVLDKPVVWVVVLAGSAYTAYTIGMGGVWDTVKRDELVRHRVHHYGKRESAQTTPATSPSSR